MIQYFEKGQIACIDDHVFRRDRKTGYYLSTRPLGSRRKRLHVYVWEKYFGAIPHGYQVHHIDHDKGNNEPENLALLTVKEHRQIHADEIEDGVKDKLIRNLIEKAIPASKAWHSSAEGIEWHRQHATAIMEQREPVTYYCTMCGKEFQTRHLYGENENRFCSNNCKSAYRRKSGVDNIEKVCNHCGKKYIANKYSKTKYCPECKNNIHKGRWVC